MSTTYNVGVDIKGNAAGLGRAAKEALAHTKQMGAGMGKEFAKMAKAREQLGIRPEREIQREIQRTEAAYNRLARSGTLSFNDQRRAAAAMRDEVTKLSNEMGKLTTRQKAMRAVAIGGGVAVAGGVAGAYVAPKVKTALAYDVRLAHLANTAYNDRDSSGRKSGRRELDSIIADAVRYGGGTRDSAVDTAETLFGSGIFKPGQVKAILKEALLGATANNADPASFAQMAISANQTMGIAPEQMARIFGMGTFAGQAGGFEIKDMAKWLPQQMAAAKAVGMYGEKGFAKLAAVNQAAVVTAGTKDEAGNNVVNLLAKMGSQDTAKDFKKMGINLPQQLAEGRMKGQDAFDVVGGLLEQQLGKDKNYQNVKKQLSLAKTDQERKQALGAVGDIAQGTVIGKVFQDRQALMALYAYLNARDRVNSITSGALNNPGAAQKNMDVIGDTAGFKVDQAANERAMATQAVIDKMLPAIGGFADGLTSLMRQYPGYTTIVGLAAAAVTALGGAAGMAALALRAGGVPSMPGGVGDATKTAGRAAGGAGKFGRFMGTAGKLLGPLGILMALEGVSDEDIAKAKSWDAKKDARDNYRGRGFNDPRLVGSGSAAALEQSLRATEVKGEITVRVVAPPGFGVETVMNSGNARIPMKAALGQTNLAAGS